MPARGLEALRRPPPAPAGSPFVPPRAAGLDGNGRPAEDDDSEGDVLSISSDDDDDHVATSKKDRSDIVVKRQEQPRRAPLAKDVAELDEDGEEPIAWDEVREEELERQVRDMRQGPPVDPIRTGTTVVGDSMQIQQGDLLDPLGLGAINLKSMTLLRGVHVSMSGGLSAPGSNTSSPARQAMLRGMMKDGKINYDGLQVPESPASSQAETPGARIDNVLKDKCTYYSENFDSKAYLATIHRETPAADLETGQLALKKDLHNRKEQLKRLVKENFDYIHKRMKEIEEDKEGAGTIQLSAAIAEVDSVAKLAFGTLLERQEHADRIRSVQGLLQRFRTLFNLPSTIRSHIKRKEYDVAIREYKKAKSLVIPTQVGILKRVLEEVDKVIHEFKEVLYKSMEDPSVELSEVEKSIQLLHELEPESDPVWHYLCIQDRRIRGLLEGCSIEHESHMEALQEKVQEQKAAAQRWKELQQISSQASEVDLSLLVGDDNEDDESGATGTSGGLIEEADALQLRLIRRLSTILEKNVPHFWRLSISIFSGRFAMDEQLRGGKGGNRVVSGVDDSSSRYMRHTEEEIQVAFVALADGNILRPQVRSAVSDIASTCSAFMSNDWAPPAAVQALLVLRIEVTLFFVTRLCSLMRATTQQLSEEEDWCPVPNTLRQEAPVAISAFPLRFLEMMTAAMSHISDVLEKMWEDDNEMANRGIAQGNAVAEAMTGIQNSVKVAFFDSFFDFSDCIEKMAEQLPQTSTPDQGVLESPGIGPASPNGSMLGNGSGLSTSYTGLEAGEEVASPHQRILMLLSNSSFCRVIILPELTLKYERLWIGVDGSEDMQQHPGVPLPPYMQRPETDSNYLTSQKVNEHLISLEEKLLNQYLDAKAALLGPAVAAYLLEDGTQWSSAPPVKGLRDSALELMHPLVEVHAEVFTGAMPFLDRAIAVLAEGLMHALLSVSSEHKALNQLDPNAFCQLSLELDYFETILASFTTPAMEDTVISLREQLLDRTLEGLQLYNESLEPAGARGRRSQQEDVDDKAAALPLLHSPEDVLAMARGLSADFLAAELKRTRINVVCFTEARPQEDGLGYGTLGQRAGTGQPVAGQPYNASSQQRPLAGSSGRPYGGGSVPPTYAPPQVGGPPLQKTLSGGGTTGARSLRRKEGSGELLPARGPGLPPLPSHAPSLSNASDTSSDYGERFSKAPAGPGLGTAAGSRRAPTSLRRSLSRQSDDELHY
eukprot:SM000092S24495  [mRNA]  locus=s92:340613:348688:+ [translate_table: standard]